jgi:2-oxoglutarate-Fe(II)-dependent oxygenase superfamily protein
MNVEGKRHQMDAAPTSITLRTPVGLPSMPGEAEAAQAYPAIELQRSQVIGDRLLFEDPAGYDRALAQGFFLVRMPEGLDVTAADLFAAHFFQDKNGDEFDRYRGFQDIDVPGDYQGYFDREHDQWENFYIEMGNWQLLPPEVALVGDRMTELGILVLRNVLDYLAIPQKYWSMITSGLSEKRGHQMLAFNHFRPDKDVRGCKFHRDSGWVTILRSTEPGLLALIEGKLRSVNPEPGYFIANFGSSIEVLTGRMGAPVRANVHGVARTERDTRRPHRWSYVTFLDSSLSGYIYQYQDGEPKMVQTVADFAVQEVSRTYDDDNANL